MATESTQDQELGSRPEAPKAATQAERSPAERAVESLEREIESQSSPDAAVEAVVAAEVVQSEADIRSTSDIAKGDANAEAFSATSAAEASAAIHAASERAKQELASVVGGENQPVVRESHEAKRADIAALADRMDGLIAGYKIANGVVSADMKKKVVRLMVDAHPDRYPGDERVKALASQIGSLKSVFDGDTKAWQNVRGVNFERSWDTLKEQLLSPPPEKQPTAPETTEQTVATKERERVSRAQAAYTKAVAEQDPERITTALAELRDAESACAAAMKKQKNLSPKQSKMLAVLQAESAVHGTALAIREDSAALALWDPGAPERAQIEQRIAQNQNVLATQEKLVAKTQAAPEEPSVMGGGFVMPDQEKKETQSASAGGDVSIYDVGPNLVVQTIQKATDKLGITKKAA